MNLIEESRSFLHRAGYKVAQSPYSSSTLHFEDMSLYGFISIFLKAEELIYKWEADQDKFLQAHSESLRNSPEKAWNVYSVFLTEAKASPEIQIRLAAIEEDFRGTRKIARSHLVTIEDVHRALFPLLPIGNLVKLQAEDPYGRLRERLNTGEKETDALLGEGEAAYVVRLLLGE